MTEQAPQTPDIPEGYMEDAQGRLVPEHLVKPVDQERDRLVKELIEAAKNLREAMARFKGQAFGDIEAFVELSAEQYGAKLGGKKGNVTLLTYDGRYKVQRAISESIAFDERLQAAKALIDECLSEWSEGAKPELLTIVNDAFRADQKGDIRTARVLALRRLEIADHRWKQAMQAIGEACQVVGSKSYVRFYERVGDTDQYHPISLDLASL
jgi:hypothetical protein